MRRRGIKNHTNAPAKSSKMFFYNGVLSKWDLLQPLQCCTVLWRFSLSTMLTIYNRKSDNFISWFHILLIRFLAYTHRENMACLKIIKGMFFFYYCLLLPLIWTLHYLFIFVKRKWKRHKRKKNFRVERASGNQAEDQAYLQLDKYSRGKIEREIIEFDAELRKERKERVKTGEDTSNWKPLSVLGRIISMNFCS